jgi:hypothetical protein
MTKNSLILVYIVPAILLLLVTFINFPYGFYTFLRMVVSISSGFIIYLNYKEEKKITVNIIIFTIIFLLFNPIIPVHLTKSQWVPIDIITSIIFIYSYFKNIKK